MPRTDDTPIKAAESTDLRDIRTWIFDLDNTLYRVTDHLSGQTNGLLRGFVSQYLGIGDDEAHRVQKQYFRQYGLTMRGLILHHGLDPDVYIEWMSQADFSSIEPDRALSDAITRLPGRKIVYTNSFRRHTDSILDRLDMAHLFDAVYDIETADYVPKPARESYERLCDLHAIEAGSAAMVDDLDHNLAPAAALGMTTVWLTRPKPDGRTGKDPDYIHHVTDDLAAWLETTVHNAA